MMKEAQEMMADPNFQTNMKQMMQGQGFQEAMSQTNTDLQDPVKLKAMEEKAEKAIEEGNKELEEQERLRRLQVTAAVAKAQKDRDEAEAGAGEASTEAEEDDKKEAADDKTKEDDVPAFQMNLN
jgi:phage terminase large subunit GpA-like protein